MSLFPSGTVTFLFTDIEGSTKLARSLLDKWETTRARHNEILRSAIDLNNGTVFQVIGDAFCAAFHTPGDALRSAIQSQIDLQNENWGANFVRVRMGIHTGTAQPVTGINQPVDYRGYAAMAHVQHLMATGHGGQVLISQATEDLLRNDIPEKISLRDMGEFRLKSLMRPEHIYQVIISGLPVDFPPLKTLDSHHHNLPTQLTSFIGREKEIKEITELNEEQRLITLTGIGGTGKTRLALQVSANLIENYPDGVWLVELAPLSDANLLPQAVASVLGLQNPTGQALSELLSEYLRNKELLLILDNCEHVIDTCAPLAHDLLQKAPRIKILATSRLIFYVDGETVYPVQPLTVPDPTQAFNLPSFTEYEAVRLFMERAVSVRPAFGLTDENYPLVVQICQRLDGIPLAIELAAARMRALSPKQIARHLENRFELLTGGNRSALPRQQTLRATMDWSYELLTKDEQLLLNQLSVFAGGFSLEAVEYICKEENGSQNNVIDHLTALFDHSLVEVKESKNDIRYHILETVRQYASEKLIKSGKQAATQKRYLDYFLNFAEAAEPYLVSHDQLEWMATLDAEHENFHAALKNSLNSSLYLEAGLKITSALCEYWQRSGRIDELIFWLEKALEKCQHLKGTSIRAKLLYQYSLMVGTVHKKWTYVEPLLKESLETFQTLGESHLSDYAYALALLGWMNNSRNEFELGKANIQEATRIFQDVGDKRGLGWASNTIFGVMCREGNFHKAFELSEKGAALYRECGDRYGEAICLSNLGIIKNLQDNYQDAREYYEEALKIFKNFKDKGFSFGLLNDLGETYRNLDEYEKAERCYRESLALGHEVGFASRTFINIYLNLGFTRLHQGEDLEAVRCFKKAFDLCKDMEDKTDHAWCMAGFASVAAFRGKPKEAAFIFGVVDSINQSLLADGIKLESLLSPVDLKEYDHYLSLCRDQLDSTEFETAMDKGRNMTLEAATNLIAQESFN